MSSESTKPRVLVVEDDPAMRDLLTRQLRRKGFDVTEAGDAESVLSQPSPGAGYDLVVADVHLPGQSGVELARHLRKGDADTRVVFVTGDHDEALARGALDEGACGYLLKPFEFFELEAMVRAALKPVQTLLQSRRKMDSAIAGRAGRDLTQVANEQRILARWQEAISRPEKVVIRQGTSTKRPPLFGWKAVAAVAGSVLLSWLAGHAVFPIGGDPADIPPAAVQEMNQPPQIMPVVIEQEPRAKP